MHALLELAVAGQGSLIFLTAETGIDKTAQLGVQNLELIELICLREAVGQALDSLRSN